MKLYGHPYSSAVRKVMITLAEKKIKADFIHVELAKGEQKSDAHLKLHPFGVVPVLDDDGFMLYESRAICRYLDAKFPNPSLVPKNPQALAKMEQWISVEHSYLASAAGKIFVQKVLNPMRGIPTDLLALNSGKKETEMIFGLLDNQLRTQPYLAGEEFTLADVFFMPYYHQLESSKELNLLASFVYLNAWWNKVNKRSSLNNI